MYKVRFSMQAKFATGWEGISHNRLAIYRFSAVASLLGRLSQLDSDCMTGSIINSGVARILKLPGDRNCRLPKAVH